MGPWGYVFLAYGVVWGAILFYWISLNRRLRKAESELAMLRAVEHTQADDKKK